MDIKLSWDLFILVFFVVIVAYSFIIGRDNTLKVILGSYVAALAADATGNLFARYFGGSDLFVKILKFAALGTEDEAVIFVKVLIFVSLVILFAVRGAFTVSTQASSGPTKLLVSIVYAVMSAGLIISTILVFVSGVSFVGGTSSGTSAWDVYQQSRFVQSMVQNSYIWFSVPALAFLIQSFSGKKEGQA